MVKSVSACVVSNRRVNIVLATLNGSRYIVDQLESLANQTYKNISIYIRDDGSKDGTVELIKSWIEENQGVDINFVCDEKGTLGYPECFFEILRASGDADYYSFCDQDDIWDSNKVQVAVQSLDRECQSTPLLFYSAFEYCDSFLCALKGSAEVPYRKIKLHNVIFDLMEAFGFSIVINRELRERLLRSMPINCSRKDWWLLVMAAGMGKVLYSKNSLALYRRHSRAVTFEGTSLSWIKKWARRVKTFLVNGDIKKIRIDLREFLRLYGNCLKKSDREAIEIFSGVAPFSRVRCLFFGGKIRRKMREDLLFRLSLLLT
jgi:glycosyltransferase involved in cell wall biosynthesis